MPPACLSNTSRQELMTAEKDRPVVAELQGGLDRRCNLRLSVGGAGGAGDEAL